MGRHVKIYTAESKVADLPEVFRSMLRGFRDTWYVAWRLFIKDLKGDYSRAKFGLIWDFLDPFILALIFYGLEKAGRIKIGTIHIPSSLFLVYRFVLYHTFMESVTMPMDVIVRSRTMLAHLKLPPEALLFSVGYRLVFNSLFRVMIMFLFTLMVHPFPTVGFLVFLVLFPAIILTGYAIGVVLSPFNAIYKDVGRCTRILLQPLRYLTPVMYVIPDAGLMAYINIYNPLTNILTNLRDIATGGAFHDPLGFVLRVVLLFALLLGGWFVFHLSIPILAERA